MVLLQNILRAEEFAARGCDERIILIAQYAEAMGLRVLASGPGRPAALVDLATVAGGGPWRVAEVYSDDPDPWGAAIAAALERWNRE